MKLTEKEQGIVCILAKAWNSFTELEVLHEDDASEFKFAIHAAQMLVLSRPTVRDQKAVAL